MIFVEHDRIPHEHAARVEYHRFPRGLSPLRRFIGEQRRQSFQVWRLRRQWRSVCPDVCHFQWFDNRVYLAAQAGLRPLVATAWGSDLNWMMLPEANQRAREAVSWSLRQIDLLIVDSADMIETANSLAGATINSQLLPIGIDTNRFRPDLPKERQEWRNNWKVGPQTIVIISPRASPRRYRHETILQAFAKAASTFDVCLVVRVYNCDDRNTLKRLQALSNSLGIADRVRWIGEIPYDRLPGIYAASDFAVNFPEMDAFPVTFLECLSCGIPVLTNRLASYARSDVASYLNFVDDNAFSLQEGLKAAIEDLTRIRAAVRDGRSFVVQHHDERVTAEYLNNAYQRVLLKEGGNLRVGNGR